MISIIKKHAAACYRSFLCAAFLVVLFSTGLETTRIAPVAVCIALALCVGLVLCRRSRFLTLPFLLLTLLLIFCYDSYEVFIGYIWLAPVVIVALVVHLIRLKPRLRIGASFWPLCAVALATMLGGVGQVQAAEYFAPTALYYSLGLGPLLVGVYLILKNEFADEQDRASLLPDLAAFGMTAAAVVIFYRAFQVPVLLETGTWPSIQWSNNISTMLMLAVPAVFVLSEKHLAWLGAGFAVAAAAILTGSRAGVLFMPVVVFAVLLWLWLREPREHFVRRAWLNWFFWFSVFWLSGMAVLALTGWLDFALPKDNEVRWGLFERSLEDLAASPIFGKGLCYSGNADLYAGKQGCINWYHMFVPQVLGSLGLLGVLTWGWQLFTRARLAYRARRTTDFTFALCYFGLFLMSQVNPGEFCPLPYAFCAVLCFVALEREEQNLPC